MVFMSEFILITVSLCLMTKECEKSSSGSQGPRLLSDGAPSVGRIDCKSSHETYFLVALAYILSIKYIAYYFSFVVVDTYPLRAANADKQCVVDLWKQYIISLLFSAFLCVVAAVLYATPRWSTFAVYVGGITNTILALDCLCQAKAAHYKVYHMVFPNIEEIRAVQYAALDAEGAQGNVWHLRECMICLCDFEEEDSVVRLPCKHIFHTDCVGKWLRERRGCPVKCRLPPYTLELPPLGGELGEMTLADLEAAAGPGGPRLRNQAWADAGVRPALFGAPLGREAPPQPVPVVQIVD